MATVSVSLSASSKAPAPAMASKRAPLASNPNVANSPLRAPSILAGYAKPKRSFATVQREEPYGQPPPVKKQALENGAQRAVRSPSKPLARAPAHIVVPRNSSAVPRPVARERTARTATATETRATQDVEREAWKKHHRAKFPKMVFYFESIPDDVRAKLTKRVTYLGARQEPFFSIDVTHVITTRAIPPEKPEAGEAEVEVSEEQQPEEQPQTINPSLLDRNTAARRRLLFDFRQASSVPSQLDGLARRNKTIRNNDVLTKARDMGKKIWSLDKFQSMLAVLLESENQSYSSRSARICYVDKDEPRKHSAALNLKEVDRYEFYAGFLKSSAKITIVPKPLKRSTLHNRVVSSTGVNSRGSTPSPAASDSAYTPPSGPPPITTATWVCTICSFSNPVPSNFDPVAANAHTPLPPCLACGIKPTLSQVLKAAITSATNRPTASPNASQAGIPSQEASSITTPQPSDPFSTCDARVGSGQGKPDATVSFHCPRCTFSNHPSLLSCEMCGAPLLSQNIPSNLSSAEYIRTQSPGPVKDSSNKPSQGGTDFAESVKISFRGGGEKIFYERLKSAMTQRKWLLQDAPPAPKSNRAMDDNSTSGSPSAPVQKTKTAGIAGLEQLGLNMRKNNEILIGSAFEDLEALMASAKEVVALAERFAQQVNGVSGDATSKDNSILAESAHQLGLITTKDIVGGGGSESLYFSELARNLAEFLTDDSRGVLKRSGGILTLVELWAMFNRARGGVELVSPMDFEKAAQMWESLKLPVRLRKFRSGVMVVQARDRTDDATIKSILAWLQDLHEFPPDRDVAWDWREFGRGVTAQEAAERFGWSLGVAEEELLMAEEHGALCREEGLEGLKFWKNYIGNSDAAVLQKKAAQEEADALIQRLKDSGFI